MAKVDFRRLKRGEYQKMEEELREVLKEMNKGNLVELFFDLLTKSEIVMLARRIRIAKLLLSGKTIREVAFALDVGFRTVETVDAWLSKGYTGYRKTFSELYEKEQERETQDLRRNAPIESGSFREIRSRYPLHYLLFNLLLDDLPERNRRR